MVKKTDEDAEKNIPDSSGTTCDCNREEGNKTNNNISNENEDQNSNPIKAQSLIIIENQQEQGEENPQLNLIESNTKVIPIEEESKTGKNNIKLPNLIETNIPVFSTKQIKDVEAINNSSKQLENQDFSGYSDDYTNNNVILNKNTNEQFHEFNYNHQNILVFSEHDIVNLTTYKIGGQGTVKIGFLKTSNTKVILKFYNNEEHLNNINNKDNDCHQSNNHELKGVIPKENKIKNELRALIKLKHPNIPQLLGVFFDFKSIIKKEIDKISINKIDSKSTQINDINDFTLDDLISHKENFALVIECIMGDLLEDILDAERQTVISKNSLSQRDDYFEGTSNTKSLSPPFPSNNNIDFLLNSSNIIGLDSLELFREKSTCFKTYSNIDKLSWANQLAEVIFYCQKLKIVHLDIKPNNIIIDNHGCLKLFDFGSCVFLNSSGRKIMNLDDYSSYTPTYVLPEIMRLINIDPQSTVMVNSDKNFFKYYNLDEDRIVYEEETGKSYDYFDCIEITEKADVWNFALVISEIFSLCKPWSRTIEMPLDRFNISGNIMKHKKYQMPDRICEDKTLEKVLKDIIKKGTSYSPKIRASIKYIKEKLFNELIIMLLMNEDVQNRSLSHGNSNINNNKNNNNDIEGNRYLEKQDDKGDKMLYIRNDLPNTQTTPVIWSSKCEDKNTTPLSHSLEKENCLVTSNCLDSQVNNIKNTAENSFHDGKINTENIDGKEDCKFNNASGSYNTNILTGHHVDSLYSDPLKVVFNDYINRNSFLKEKINKFDMKSEEITKKIEELKQILKENSEYPYINRHANTDINSRNKKKNTNLYLESNNSAFMNNSQSSNKNLSNSSSMLSNNNNTNTPVIENYIGSELSPFELYYDSKCHNVKPKQVVVNNCNSSSNNNNKQYKGNTHTPHHIIMNCNSKQYSMKGSHQLNNFNLHSNLNTHNNNYCNNNNNNNNNFILGNSNNEKVLFKEKKYFYLSYNWMKDQILVYDLGKQSITIGAKKNCFSKNKIDNNSGSNNNNSGLKYNDVSAYNNNKDNPNDDDWRNNNDNYSKNSHNNNVDSGNSIFPKENSFLNLSKIKINETSEITTTNKKSPGQIISNNCEIPSNSKIIEIASNLAANNINLQESDCNKEKSNIDVQDPLLMKSKISPNHFSLFKVNKEETFNVKSRNSKVLNNNNIIGLCANNKPLVLEDTNEATNKFNTNILINNNYNVGIKENDNIQSYNEDKRDNSTINNNNNNNNINNINNNIINNNNNTITTNTNTNILYNEKGSRNQQLKLSVIIKPTNISNTSENIFNGKTPQPSHSNLFTKSIESIESIKSLNAEGQQFSFSNKNTPQPFHFQFNKKSRKASISSLNENKNAHGKALYPNNNQHNQTSNQSMTAGTHYIFSKVVDKMFNGRLLLYNTVNYNYQNTLLVIGGQIMDIKLDNSLHGKIKLDLEEIYGTGTTNSRLFNEFFNGSIYPSNITFKFNSLKQKVVKLGNLNYPRSNCSVIGVRNSIFVVGGESLFIETLIDFNNDFCWEVLRKAKLTEALESPLLFSFNSQENDYFFILNRNILLNINESITNTSTSTKGTLKYYCFDITTEKITSCILELDLGVIQRSINQYHLEHWLTKKKSSLSEFACNEESNPETTQLINNPPSFSRLESCEERKLDIKYNFKPMCVAFASNKKLGKNIISVFLEIDLLNTTDNKTSYFNKPFENNKSDELHSSHFNNNFKMKSKFSGSSDIDLQLKNASTTSSNIDNSKTKDSKLYFKLILKESKFIGTDNTNIKNNNKRKKDKPHFCKEEYCLRQLKQVGEISECKMNFNFNIFSENSLTEFDNQYFFMNLNELKNNLYLMRIPIEE